MRPKPRGCGREPWPPLPTPPADAATRPAGVTLPHEPPLKIQHSLPVSEAPSSCRRDVCDAPVAGKPNAELVALRSARDPGGCTAAAAAAELMGLHTKMAHEGGAKAWRYVVARQTHDRTIAHAAAPKEGGEAVESERWKTSAAASQDVPSLRRATRRLAKRNMYDASRQFHKCRGVPEDEEAALSQRREAQEKEWRRLLRRQRAADRDMDLASHTSAASTLLSSVVPVASRAASRATAGMSTEDATCRHEDNACVAYGRQCIALCAGDALRGPPLPLEVPMKPLLPPESEYSVVP